MVWGVLWVLCIDYLMRGRPNRQLNRHRRRVDVGNSRLRRVLLLGLAAGTIAVVAGVVAGVVAVATGDGLPRIK